MSESQATEPAVPVSGRRRRLGLAAVAGGVFIAAINLGAGAGDWDVVPSIGVPDSFVDAVPVARWVKDAIYPALVLVSLPLWGKLSDVYGRRRLWLIALAMLVVGTLDIWLVAVVTEKLQFLPLLLVVWPIGIEGAAIFALLFLSLGLFGFMSALGAGAICVLGPALMGDFVPPSERARWQGVLAAMFGLALIGEQTIRYLLGEVLPLSRSDVLWWPYYLNFTVGALVAAASWIGLPAVRTTARRPADLWGAAAYVAAAGLFLVAFNLASPLSGRLFPWLSPLILALFAGAAVMLGVWMITVRRASEPFIDLRFLTNRTYLIVIIVGTVVGLTFVNSRDFALLLNIGGTGSGPSDPNPLHFPDRVAAALAFAVGAVLAGRAASRTGRNKLPILMLMLIGLFGSVLLARMTSRTGLLELAFGTAVLGLSLGGLFALLIAAAQNALPRQRLGEVSAGLVFIVGLGVALAMPLYFWLRQVAYVQSLGDLWLTMPDNVVDTSVEQNSVGVVFSIHVVLLAVGSVVALWLPGPLALREALFKTKRRPNLQEILRAREDEQRRALEASRARAEQRRRAMDAATDDADGAEQAAGGPE